MSGLPEILRIYNITYLTHLIMNRTIPQKQIRTANTDKMFDSSATDTNIAVIATSILGV